MVVNAHENETYAAMIKSDPQLKDFAAAKWRTLASDSSVSKTQAALEAKKFTCVVVNTGEEALAWLKNNIPAGSTVSNSHSTSLEEIGYIEHLKQQTAWNNLYAKAIAETDPAKSAAAIAHGHNADYYVSSATAISEAGDITAADATGTKVGAFNFSAGKLVLVVGTQKIVPAYADCVKRTEECALTLESARVRIAYKVPASQMSNFVAIRNGNPFAPQQRVIVILVKQPLGY